MDKVMPIIVGTGIILGLVLIAGLVAGQFRRGVIEELRATLSTAKSEIDIERARSDRHEREAEALRQEVAALRAEVRTLRSVLTDDRKVAQAVAEALRLDDDLRSNHAVNELKEALSRHTEQVIEVIERKVNP